MALEIHLRLAAVPSPAPAPVGLVCSPAFPMACDAGSPSPVPSPGGTLQLFCPLHGP